MNNMSKTINRAHENETAWEPMPTDFSSAFCCIGVIAILAVGFMIIQTYHIGETLNGYKEAISKYLAPILDPLNAYFGPFLNRTIGDSNFPVWAALIIIIFVVLVIIRYLWKGRILDVLL